LRLSAFARNLHRSAWFLAKALRRKVPKGPPFLVAAKSRAGLKPITAALRVRLTEVSLTR
jgi:hypothetical protein